MFKPVTQEYVEEYTKAMLNANMQRGIIKHFTDKTSHHEEKMRKRLGGKEPKDVIENKV